MSVKKSGPPIEGGKGPRQTGVPITVTLRLPRRAVDALEADVSMCRMRLEDWIAEAVEVVLADRRGFAVTVPVPGDLGMRLVTRAAAEGLSPSLCAARLLAEALGSDDGEAA